jgi:hypothetical protein
MTVGGSTSSDVRASDVREALRKTGTLLYALSPIAGAGGAGPIDLVLNDGSCGTGGRNERFSGQTLSKIACWKATQLQTLGEARMATVEIHPESIDGPWIEGSRDGPIRRSGIPANIPTFPRRSWTNHWSDRFCSWPRAVLVARPDDVPSRRIPWRLDLSSRQCDRPEPPCRS